MKQVVLAGLLEASAALQAMLKNEAVLETITEAGMALAASLRAGGRVFSCGNGGSMCDAMHFAEELSGRYRNNRPALAATAISDVGHMTCVANDYGYEQVFSRYIEGHGRRADFLVAISTSGTSKSILRAAETAQLRGMQVIGLHGRPGSALSEVSNYNICTPAGAFADRVQECHIKVLHILIEVVERSLFPDNYAS
jgi:D-sedoheptulose 7-phosphate isomerase